MWGHPGSARLCPWGWEDGGSVMPSMYFGPPFAIFLPYLCDQSMKQLQKKSGFYKVKWVTLKTGIFTTKLILNHKADSEVILDSPRKHSKGTCFDGRGDFHSRWSPEYNPRVQALWRPCTEPTPAGFSNNFRVLLTPFKNTPSVLQVTHKVSTSCGFTKM